MTIKYAKKGSNITVFPMGEISLGYKEITKEEYDFLFVEKNKLSLTEQIEILESEQTPRMLRGAALGIDADIKKLKSIEEKIKTLREKLKG